MASTEAIAPRARRGMETTHGDNQPQPRRQHSAKRSKESEKKASEKQPGSYKDEGDRRQGRRDPADRARQEADPRPRLVARPAAPGSARGQVNCCGRGPRCRRTRHHPPAKPARPRPGRLCRLPGVTPDRRSRSPWRAIARCSSRDAGRRPPVLTRRSRSIGDEGSDGITAAVGGPGGDVRRSCWRRMRGEGGVRLRADHDAGRRQGRGALRRRLVGRLSPSAVVRRQLAQRAASARAASTPRSSGASGGRRGPAA